MPIINENGQKINGEELKVVEEMLSGSLDSQIARLKELRDRAKQKDKAEKFYNPLIEEYEKARANLHKNIQKSQDSRQNTTVWDFMTGYSDDIAKKAAPKVDKDSSFFIEFSAFVGTGLGNPAYLELLGKPDSPVPQPVQDKEESYLTSIAPFKFSDAPMEGIEEIGTYNPATDSVKGLYTMRTGNSTTLSKTPEEYEAEKQQVLNAPNLNEREKQKRVDKINQKQDAYVKGTFGLNAAAEVARIGSVELASKGTVTVGDLFKIFSELNMANRPSEPLAGKLRGTGIHAGDIMGVSSSRAPGTLYRTLDMVANKYNEIREIKDPALRKTRALELVAFADGLLISEHVFADTNGRTCRMFADTLLQSFGLPPHTPIKAEEASKARTLGQPMDYKQRAEVIFRGIKKSDEVLQEENRLKAEEGIPVDSREVKEAKRIDTKVTALEDVVKRIAKEAGEKLKALEGMSKKGHVNGGEYNAMHDALKALSELDPEKSSVVNVVQSLKTLNDTSKEYQRTHTGWFVARPGYGENRLNASKDFQTFSSSNIEKIKGLSWEIDKDKPINNLHPKHNEPNKESKAVSKGGRERSKRISFDELTDKEPKKAPRKRSNSVSLSSKPAEKQASQQKIK